MAMQYTCDFCGEPIEDDDTFAEMNVTGDVWESSGSSSRYVYRAWIGHYHTRPGHDSPSCYRRVLDSISAQAGNKARSEASIRKDAEDAWRRLSRDRRESLVFQVLGDRRLVIREITAGMNAELGYPQQEGRHNPRAVCESEVGNLVKRMLREGQLQREAETFNKTHTRYRYSRRRDLDGPIADLERAYNAEGGA
jgi:hypothetical protein